MKWSDTLPKVMLSSLIHSRQVVQSLGFDTTALFFFLPKTEAGQQSISF